MLCVAVCLVFQIMQDHYLEIIYIRMEKMFDTNAYGKASRIQRCMGNLAE